MHPKTLCSGTTYGAFAWSAGKSDTPGDVNVGQTVADPAAPGEARHRNGSSMVKIPNN